MVGSHGHTQRLSNYMHYMNQSNCLYTFPN